MLIVDGIPGLSVDDQQITVLKSVFAKCPGVNIVGSIIAGFDPGQAKTKTIQFLATHPDKVDGVWQIIIKPPSATSSGKGSRRAVHILCRNNKPGG